MAKLCHIQCAPQLQALACRPNGGLRPWRRSAFGGVGVDGCGEQPAVGAVSRIGPVAHAEAEALGRALQPAGTPVALVHLPGSRAPVAVQKWLHGLAAQRLVLHQGRHSLHERVRRRRGQRRRWRAGRHGACTSCGSGFNHAQDWATAATVLSSRLRQDPIRTLAPPAQQAQRPLAPWERVAGGLCSGAPLDLKADLAPGGERRLEASGSMDVEKNRQLGPSVALGQ